MLSGSALVRALLLVVLAAVLALLVERYVLLPSDTEAALDDPAPTRAPAPAPPAKPPPAPVAAAPPPAEPPPVPAPPVRTPPPAPEPPAVKPPAPMPPPPPPPMADPGDGMKADEEVPKPEPAPKTDTAKAEPEAGPRAVELVDLNTASLAELNGLRGGGAIGRAVIARRPYASIDQLLTKRVLNRATFERIRGQVTVR